MDNQELALIREYKVVKHNKIIQRSRYKLSAQEQKIILYLITKIKPEDTELDLYEFKIKNFCEMCGIDETSGGNYAFLKKAVKDLSDKSIWVTLDNGLETLIRWVERPYIDKKSGTIKIKLDEFMRPYLLELKEHFTAYNLYFTLAMKSKYSIRIYELLKSYEYLSEFTFDIEELKKMIFAEKYKMFKDLRVKVIDIAVREINDFSDITITYKIVKNGRKADKIRFTIEPKNDTMHRMETFRKIEERINPAQIPEWRDVAQLKTDSPEEDNQ